MLPCDKCETMVPDDVMECPGCGRKFKSAKATLSPWMAEQQVQTSQPRKEISASNVEPLHLLMGVIGLVLLTFLWVGVDGLFQSGKTTSAVTVVDTPSQSLSVNEIHDAYEANEVAADERYKGRTVALIGKVESIGKDILGDPYVMVKALDGSSKTVQCMFEQSQTQGLASLSKEESIRVVGVVEGKLVYIGLSKCRFERF